MAWSSVTSASSVTEAVILEADGKPAGFAVWFYSYSTWQAKNGLYLEDLYVSPDAVRVTYQFENTTDADVSALVAFPLPDITGSVDFMVSVPSEDPENIFGFATSFAGTPVEAELHQTLAEFDSQLVVNQETLDVIHWIRRAPLPPITKPIYALLFQSALASLPKVAPRRCQAAIASP